MTRPTLTERKFSWAQEGDGDIYFQALGRGFHRNARGKKDKIMPVVARNNVVKDKLNTAKSMVLQFIADRRLQLPAEEEALAQSFRQALLELKAQEAQRSGSSRLSLHPDATRPEAAGTRLDAAMAAWDKHVESKIFLSQLEERIHGTPIYSAEEHSLDVKLPGGPKVYVLGHGAAGLDYLGADRHARVRFSLKTVAASLAKTGLPGHTRSIKLPSCGSADVFTRTSLAEIQNPLKTGLLGFGKTVAPAQSFADSLYKAGFKEVRVTGYKGLGEVFPLGEHQERSIGDDRFRASLARQIFTHK